LTSYYQPDINNNVGQRKQNKEQGDREMTMTQIQAMRQMWNSTQIQGSEFSARDMNLEPGQWINQDLFYHADGRKFAWIEFKQLYVEFK
jgi:ribosomal protein S8E